MEGHGIGDFFHVAHLHHGMSTKKSVKLKSQTLENGFWVQETCFFFPNLGPQTSQTAKLHQNCWEIPFQHQCQTILGYNVVFFLKIVPKRNPTPPKTNTLRLKIPSLEKEKHQLVVSMLFFSEVYPFSQPPAVVLGQEKHTNWVVATQFFFSFHTKNWGRWTHFDDYFSDGLVQPPTSKDDCLVS